MIPVHLNTGVNSPKFASCQFGAVFLLNSVLSIWPGTYALNKSKGVWHSTHGIRGDSGNTSHCYLKRRTVRGILEHPIRAFHYNRRIVLELFSAS